MTNAIITLISRFLSIPPLVYIFCSVFKTYYDKLHSINGLRKTRVVILLLVLALIVDNLLFLYFSAYALVSNVPVGISQPALIFDKIMILLSIYGLLYLFIHASKED